MTVRVAIAAFGVCAMLASPQARQGQQAVPVQQAQPQPPPAQQPQPQPTYRGSTTLVEVDVIVRDRDRRFVADLRADEFDVFEEGVRQDVSAVYRVIGPTERVTPDYAGKDPLPPPPPQQVQRVLVFFFDQAHIQPGAFDRAKKAAIAFMKTSFRPGDVGGVVNGGTMVNQRLTSVREELEAAIASIKPAPQASTVTRELRQWPRFVDLYEAYRVTRNEPANSPGAKYVLDQVVQRACIDQPSSCERGGSTMVEAETQNKATQLVAQARLLGTQTIETVSGLANGLAKLPGRKTIVMMTEGFFVEDSWADLRAVVGRAARASVRIYALDTRGLDRGSASSDILNAANPSQPELAGPTMGDTNADGPNSLAVDTGGYVIRNQNDFGKAFTEIDRDTSSYYVLGYRTSRPLDGKFHAIDVKVRRSGMTVRARKGYVATASAALAAETAAARTPDAPPPVSAAPAVPDAPDPAAVGIIKLRPDMAQQVAVLEPKTGTDATRGAYPDTLRKKAQEGWDAYQRGSVASAQASLEIAAKHAAAPPWVKYVLGWAQLSQANPGAAATSWELVRASVPEFSAVYFDLADAYLQQREFGKAVEVLRAAEKRWPKDVEVYNALGVIQLVRGAVDEAISTFEKGVGVGPTDSTAAYNLARTYELRFIRASRLRQTGPGTVELAPLFRDRDRAVDYYRRTIALGGPFVEQAKEGLTRLSAK